MTRAPRVVLWGGRPGLDRQFGGPLDLMLARMKRDLTALRREVLGRLYVDLDLQRWVDATPASHSSLDDPEEGR